MQAVAAVLAMLLQQASLTCTSCEEGKGLTLLICWLLLLRLIQRCASGSHHLTQKTLLVQCCTLLQTGELLTNMSACMVQRGFLLQYLIDRRKTDTVLPSLVLFLLAMQAQHLLSAAFASAERQYSSASSHEERVSALICPVAKLYILRTESIASCQ